MAVYLTSSSKPFSLSVMLDIVCWAAIRSLWSLVTLASVPRGHRPPACPLHTGIAILIVLNYTKNFLTPSQKKTMFTWREEDVTICQCVICDQYESNLYEITYKFAKIFALHYYFLIFLFDLYWSNASIDNLQISGNNNYPLLRYHTIRFDSFN